MWRECRASWQASSDSVGMQTCQTYGLPTGATIGRKVNQGAASWWSRG
jgi:hypothetical protein